jgi:hypothetical protein
MVTYHQEQPYTKRTPTITDVTDKVQRQGLDNLYAQRCIETAKRSYTLKSVLDRYGDFLNGEGFQNELVGNIVVNTKGYLVETLNDILNKITRPNNYAGFKSFALHIQYNLNYTMATINVLPYEYCRFAATSNGGECEYILYSTNWERDGRKEWYSDRVVHTYDIFNPDPLIVQQQIEKAGGIEFYKGQILFYTPEPGQYALATYDPVIDHAQTQAELGLYKISNAQNKFLADLAIVYPGEFESEQERADFKNLIEGKSGGKNAGKRIGLQDKTGTKKASDIFQTLNVANTDRLFEYTEKSVVDAITECFAQPKEITGIRPESGMFNQDNVENAYTYYNAATANDRAILSRFFAKLMTYWWQPVNDPCLIKPQQYVKDSSSGTDSVDVRDNLANMSGRQAQNLGRIIRKFAKGEYTLEQAKVLLQGGYGLSNEEIDKLLGINEEPTE